MRVLVIGSGGREHAICKQFLVDTKNVYCVPGNDGIAQIANTKFISMNKFDEISDFVKANNIDYTFVGPEIPLANGITDYFFKKGLKIIGPSKYATLLESSKIYAKNFMKKFNIPTANFKSFDNASEALFFLKQMNNSKKIVIKADGLAAGKGVKVCNSKIEANSFINQIMTNKVFGDSGNRIIIEDYIEGSEISYMLFTDGVSYSVMPTSQDHKQIYDNDCGDNTGGMGAYSPVNLTNMDSLNKKIEETIIKRVMCGIKEENLNYKGILYIGVIIDNTNSPYVLEFNCRLGDPETQVVLPLLNTSLNDICDAILNKNLSKINISWKKQMSVGVVLTSNGYPKNYETGFEISGLEKVSNNTFIFHSGTKSIVKNGKISFITNGGRVLSLTVLDDNLQNAIKKVYLDVSKIHFRNMYFRKDIGFKGIK
ncbi:MAG: phosphoribosylamine--glycine ligase [Endomicrobium sp.]|jgi:phosphoribosylamine--glycine ligase|nr:phosphoribosylamine--glycine ligase [Endomicrobium sp.]